MYDLSLSLFSAKLYKKILKSQKIIIVSHILPDFDAIGASVGIASICNYLRKDNYILIKENITELDEKMQKVVLEAKESYNIINVEEFNDFNKSECLLVSVDVNKTNLIPTMLDLTKFNDIFIIDHHKKDNNTINTSLDNSYISVESSSASEIVSKLIIDYGINIDSKCATLLYSGIVLDTNKFTKNTTSSTFFVASELLKRGADITSVNNLFKRNFVQNVKIYDLIKSTKFLEYYWGIAGVAKKTNQLYSTQEIATAADEIVNEDGVDMSIAIGPVDKFKLKLSARSIGKDSIDVSQVMKEFGGGGNINNAAAEIKREDSKKVLIKIKTVLSKI